MENPLKLGSIAFIRSFEQKTNSLYINFYYYLCIKLQHQGVE